MPGQLTIYLTDHGQVGHAYIGLAGRDGTTEYWGYYPKAEDGLLSHLDGIGAVKNDLEKFQNYDKISSVPITLDDQQFENVRNYIHSVHEHPETYHFLSHNCVDFANGALISAGVDRNIGNYFTADQLLAANDTGLYTLAKYGDPAHFNQILEEAEMNGAFTISEIVNHVLTVLPEAHTVGEAIDKINEEVTPPNYGPMVMNEGNDYVEPANPLQVASIAQEPLVNIGDNPGVIIDPADGVTATPASTQISDDIGSTYVQIEPVSNEAVVPSDTIFSPQESVFPGEALPVTMPQDEPVILAQNDTYTEQATIPANEVYAAPLVVDGNMPEPIGEQPGIQVADIFATTPSIGSDNGNWGIQPGNEQPSVPVTDIFAATPSIGSGGDNWSQPNEQPSIQVQDVFANTPYIDSGNVQGNEPSPEVQSVFHVDTVTASNEITPSPPENSWTDPAPNTSPTDSWTSSVSDNSQTTSISDNSPSI